MPHDDPIPFVGGDAQAGQLQAGGGEDDEGDIFDPAILEAILGGGGEGVPSGGGTFVGGGAPSGGSAGPSPQQLASHRRSLIMTVQGYGIRLSPNIRKLIDEAVKQRYGLDSFLFFLRKTPEYHHRFRGKPKDMTEAQYISTENAFNAIAAQTGINLSPENIAWLFRNDVDAAEFATRAQAVGRLQRNKALFDAFAKEAVQAGLAKPGDTTREILRFVAGLGNRAWMDLWNDAVARNAAFQAGINIAQAGATEGVLELSQDLLEKLSGQGLSEEELQSGFQELAEHLLITMPISKIHRFGLTKSDLTEAVFGGPEQANIRQRMLRAIRTEAAFQEAPRVTEDFAPGARPQTRGEAALRRPQVL